MKLYLFDIEGTTTPISFVHKVLFPYSLIRFDSFLERNQLQEETLSLLLEEHKKDNYPKELLENGKPVYTNISEYLKYLVSLDRKSTALKQIQGTIWKQGYESAELESVLYEDVPIFFDKIIQSGSKIGIYSSGSVEAQKLIFQYSDKGNLTDRISYYFDTKVGGKKEPSSYRKIAELSNTPTSQITFFTDIKEEADAAFSIGYQVCIMDRPENSKQPEHSYTILNSFEKFGKIF